MYENPQVSGLEALSIGQLTLKLTSTHGKIETKTALEREDYIFVNW